MVTKMSKLSVLLYHGERENFLDKLRDVGVFHIEKADKELNTKSAAINSQLSDVEKVITEIRRTTKEFSGKCELSAAEAVKKIFGKFGKNRSDRRGNDGYRKRKKPF